MRTGGGGGSEEKKPIESGPSAGSPGPEGTALKEPAPTQPTPGQTTPSGPVSGDGSTQSAPTSEGPQTARFQRIIKWL